MNRKWLKEADGDITSLVAIAGKLYAFTATSTYRVKAPRKRYRDRHKDDPLSLGMARMRLVAPVRFELTP